MGLILAVNGGVLFGQTDSLPKAKDLALPLARPVKDSLLQILQGNALATTPGLRGRERISIWPPHYKPTRRVILNFRFDFRHSFINPTDVPVLINGFNLGVIFRNRHEVALGYYWLTNASRNSYANRVTVNNASRAANNTEVADQNIWFLSLSYAFYLVKSRWFELRFPVEIGYGNSITSTQTTTIVSPTIRFITYSEAKNVFIPGQIGAAFEIRFTRWIGGGLSGGYRTVLTQSGAKADFESWYYAYGLKVYLGYIYRDLKRLTDKNRRAVERKAPIDED